jgi:3-hydroxyacyl-CoA dehydrogenase/enoyl-CoA hydratase/3-hydroxybutyryl-CoA epimerase
MSAIDHDLQNFALEVGDDGVALVTIDIAGESVNALSSRLFGELEVILDRLENDPAVRAVVITSAKDSGFVVGADVSWLESYGPDDDIGDAARMGHHAFRRLESLHTEQGKPVVIAIHGPALGGGLELALAGSSRIATEDSMLGQPEIKLGIIPGAGGTQRLPRLIGLTAALDLMLTGRSVRARSALKTGLIDEIVPRESLLDVARRRALESIDDVTTATRGRRPLKSWLDPKHLQALALEENPLGRRVLFGKAEERMLAETKGNYPAAQALLRVVKVGAEEGTEAGYAAEIDEFTQLVGSPEAQALMSVFLDQQATKRDPGVGGGLAPAEVTSVGVLGGGLMGGGIAAVNTEPAGVRTRIKEIDDAGVRRGLAHVHKHLTGRVKRRRMRPTEAAEAMLLVTGTTDWSGFGDMDVVIEAVFEDLALKREMVAAVEGVAREDTIFASNTSSLPITDIAAEAARPENIIGMHYFSPVEKMPLLEIVTTEHTSERAIATCVALGKRQGKTVIVVNDGPGFYTTRVLGPYSVEASHLLAEGARIEDVDRAMEQWGFPVGPLQLADEVGLDVQAKIATIMIDAFGERLRPPAVMTTLTDSGRHGRKNGRGYYRYEGRTRRGPDETVYAEAGLGPRKDVPIEEIQERLSLAFVNEAVRILEDGVLRSARDGDVGAVFGLGFPPFRGGPFHWIDEVGATEIVSRLRVLEAAHGDRFAPAGLLVATAESGGRFTD